MWYNYSIQMQTSTGAFNTYTRSNHQQKDLRMTTSSIPRTSGIYVIANTKNGKVYIGQTSNGFNHRWKSHKNQLRGCYHSNPHLQAAWDKYGAKSFKFLVLEYCEIEQLNEREMHHIAIYKARGLAYNLTDGGEGTLGYIPTLETRAKMSVAQKGRKHTPETLAKISAGNKGKKMSHESRAKISAAKKGKIASSETRAKMSAIRKGRKMPPRSAEYCAKISAANKRRPPISEETRAKLSVASKGRKHKPDTYTPAVRAKMSAAKIGKPPLAAIMAHTYKWVVISPDGESMEIVNLRSFCRDNNLAHSSMLAVAHGKQIHHRGWKCRRI